MQVPRPVPRPRKSIFSFTRPAARWLPIAYIAASLRIFTGTPNGVGVATGQFLKPGDVLTSTVEGIGHLTNVCV